MVSNGLSGSCAAEASPEMYYYKNAIKLKNLSRFYI